MCGMDEDDALIASRAFASRKFKVKTVEKLAKMDKADLDKAIAAAEAEDLSASAKGDLVELWTSAQASLPFTQGASSPLAPPPAPASPAPLPARRRSLGALSSSALSGHPDYSLVKWLVEGRVGVASSRKSGAAVAVKVAEGLGGAAREAGALRSLAQSAAKAHVVGLVEIFEFNSHPFLVLELLAQSVADFLKVTLRLLCFVLCVCVFLSMHSF
jgi:hypothetical protein